MTEPATPKVFISYSHKDVAWKERVLEHLRVLENAGELTVWDDQRISAGDEWRAEIETAMQAAAVAVFLVSTDFLNSAFIRGTEIPRLLARRQDQGLRIIPVFVRPCAWKAVGWLAALQGRPRNGKTLAELGGHRAERHLAEMALEVGELLGRAPGKQVATEPQAGAGSLPTSEPHSEPPAPPPAGAETDGGPAPGEPGSQVDETLRRREPGLEFRRVRNKSIIALTLSSFGLLSNLYFLSDYKGRGFVLEIVMIFSLVGLGLGISADKDLDRLKIRKMKWAGALAIGLGAWAMVIAIFIIFNLKQFIG